jgi:molybdopterin synthase sulfur carrier subunit
MSDPHTVRFFAAARSAAGVSQCTVNVQTVTELVEALSAEFGPDFERVLAMSSLLIDGRVLSLDDAAETNLPSQAMVDVLPPFAGGSGAQLP